jgi:hypothetical protein
MSFLMQKIKTQLVRMIPHRVIHFELVNTVRYGAAYLAVGFGGASKRH